MSYLEKYFFCFLSGMAVSVSVFARGNEISHWKPEEFDIYPGYCRARIQRASKDLEMYWSKALGAKNYIHIHHYCHGLKALNMAYSSFGNKSRLGFMANQAVGQFEYVDKAALPDFFMRAELYTKLAQAHFLLKEYEYSKSRFSQAIAFDQNYVDAWVGLSDLYVQTGNRAEALRVLQRAKEQIGSNKKIELRIDDIESARGK